MDHGHAAELGSGLGQGPRNLAHLPSFLRLGPCQGLMHQTESRIGSRCGRWGCQKLAWSTRREARPCRRSEQMVGPAV